MNFKKLKQIFLIKMKKKLSKLTKKVLPLLALPILACSVYGNEKDSNKSLINIPIHLYFSLNTGSYHFNRGDGDIRPNEENYIHGIGTRWENPKILGKKLGEHLDFWALRTINSEFHNSTLLGANLSVKCSNTSLKICGGFGLGAIDGYSHNNFKFSPYLLPHLSVEYKNFGFDSYISPVAVLWTFKAMF